MRRLERLGLVFALFALAAFVIVNGWVLRHDFAMRSLPEQPDGDARLRAVD